MRAVAVLSVFFDHLFGWPAGGFVGVDVFFVLSGFFITGLLVREREAARRISFSDFYIRRVKRILPSALLVLAATVGASYLLLPSIRAKQTLIDALYAALFSANFRFEAVGADYFQQSLPPSPLQHYWSLSIEEQFYFVWPSVIVAIFAITRSARRRGNKSARRLVLFGAMGVVVAASFLWAMLMSASDPNRAYFSTFTRVWELGVGALVAIAAPWLLRLPAGIRPALAYLGLAGVVCSFVLINSAVQFPAPWAALPVLSTALIVVAFSGAEVRAMWPLTNPVAKYFGDTSYTLYLWHWPVIQLLSSVLAKGPVFYVVASVLSLGLTAATYRYYENPIRHSNWLVGTRSRGGALSRMLELTPERWGLIGGVAALAILVSLVGISYNDSIEQANKDAHESAADSAKPNATVDLAPPVDPCFGAAAMVTPGCALWNPDQPVVPSIDQLQDDKQGAYECHRKKEEAAVKSCTYGYLGDDAKRIAVVGDSHAASLLPALWPSLEQNKWRVTTFTGWGCRFDMGDRHCPMKDVQAKLLAQPFDVVLMTGFRGTGDDRVALQEALAPITAAGSSIVFIADVPRGSAEAIACLTRANTGVGKIGDCGTPRSEALAVPDEMTAAASAVPGSTLVDLTKYFCNEDRCPSVIGNVVVFLDDGGHLTATFARTLAAPIADGLRQAMQPKKQDGAAPETGESSPAPGGAAPETGESSPAPNVTGTAPPP